jgi:LmbE family N-acetylglucosaminyl deacetylase/SAM-dependent methyltransferase
VVSFDHRDPGTDEREWAAAWNGRTVEPLGWDVDRVLVLAAHPDDETLGAAGLLATAARRGIRADVVVVTDGEGSHPASPTRTPAGLAAERRDEVAAAVALVCPAAGLRFLGVADGAIDAARGEVAVVVRRMLAPDPARVLVVAPWSGDGHRDHRVLGEIAEEVCAELGAVCRGYPVWLWHWGRPADVPWPRVERLDLDDRALATKRAALAAHRTQTEPLSAAPGDEAILHAGMLAHFDRPFETFVAPPADARTLPPAYFDDVYARHDDPWGFDTRWYEERKRLALLAALPRRRYDAALELGCSTGALTALLAERCARMLSLDVSSTALARAHERLGERADVELRRAELPGEWPEGTYDLVVFSELGYYWDAGDLSTAIERMRASLRSGGHLVACHWRHPVTDYPRSGDSVHDALAAVEGLVRLVRHEEEDFLLEVFAAPPARSVAAESGLVG